jgi:HAD superfamily hydrolase (TIGR01509 family)
LPRTDLRQLPEEADTVSVDSKGVLFDLDGVLVATEELKAQAHAETVRRHGGRLDPDYYGVVMGRSHEAAARAFIAASGADLDTDTYAHVFGSIYRELLRTGLRPAPGAAALVAALEGRGYRLAVVSSSLRWMMDEVLTRTGLGGFFETSVSADDVRHEKPSPEPYLRALSELALSPDDAVVIEDSEAGVAAGAAAGMPVIAVRHRFNAGHDLSRAHSELDGLGDTRRAVRLIGSVLGDGQSDAGRGPISRLT